MRPLESLERCCEDESKTILIGRLIVLNDSWTRVTGRLLG